MKTCLAVIAIVVCFASLGHAQACPLAGGCAPPHPPTQHPSEPRSTQPQQGGSDDDSRDTGPSRYQLADRKTDTAYIYKKRYGQTGDHDDFIAARDAFVEAHSIDPAYPQACIGMVELMDMAEADGTAPSANHHAMITWAEAGLQTNLKDLQNKGRIKDYLKLVIVKEQLVMAKEDIDTLHTSSGGQDVVDPRVDVTRAYKDAQKKVAELQKKYDRANADYGKGSK